MALYMSRLPIARLSASVGNKLSAVLLEPAASPLTLAPKNTSGLVQAATARRIWLVKNVNPTWYAAYFLHDSAQYKIHVTK
jgi:hypothetical protein